MKKVTLKEIAKQTGVSTATVSYVLNNVANQTIAEETRSRILQTAKELGYVPNLAARSLVKQKTGLIGLLINQSTRSESWRKIRYSSLIDEIEAALSERGYHLILHSLDAAAPKLDIIAERKLDGVIVVDARSDRFHHISSHFPRGVPVLVIDSLINDPLFNQLMFDYASAFAQLPELFHQPQNYYAVLDDYNNEELLRHLASLLPLTSEQIHIMQSEEKLKQFINKQEARKGIIINEAIALLAGKYTASEQLTVICTANMAQLLPVNATAIAFKQQKGRLAVEQLIQLINRSELAASNKTIKIEAE